MASLLERGADANERNGEEWQRVGLNPEAETSQCALLRGDAFSADALPRVECIVERTHEVRISMSANETRTRVPSRLWLLQHRVSPNDREVT